MKEDLATHIEDKGYAYPDAATSRRATVVAIAGGICALAVGLLLHSVVQPWLDRYLLALEELAKHDPAAADRSFLNVVGD